MAYGGKKGRARPGQGEDNTLFSMALTKLVYDLYVVGFSLTHSQQRRMSKLSINQ